MRPIHRTHPASAFTLLELVVSVAIGALILTTAALCLSASVQSQRMIEPRVDIMQSARVALALMSADLRAACPLDSKFPFLGTQRNTGGIEADNIDFATHNYAPRHPREGDFCETSYFLDKTSATGQFSLWRRRNPTLAPDPLSGGSREEIAPGVSGLRIEYYDGLDWDDTWGDLEGRSRNLTVQPPNVVGMPQAVRITLSFDQATNSPLVFQTVVYLELAAIAAPSDSAPSAPAVLTNSPEGAPSPTVN
ncbi:MAG TPA: prepilin-type N-terminal cleavage/methylation domain-containing protein [Verrucomicrobiae bacterium]|nr:prepilin-type N-terminal cleavage/methylation domain-containing protein [Verrucomicrobiae bacterium]